MAGKITCEQFRIFLWGHDAIPGLDEDETDDALNDHGNECIACDEWYDAQIESVRDVVASLGSRQREILEGLINEVEEVSGVEGGLAEAYLSAIKMGHPAFLTN